MMKSEFVEQKERFLRNVSESDDVLVVILKGHLLIEESLSEVICKFSKKPELVHEARLTFYQKLKLAEALSGFERTISSEFPWKCADELNKIRNRLAHRLEINGLNAQIDYLISMRSSNLKGISFPNPELRLQALKEHIALMYGFINQLSNSN